MILPFNSEGIPLHKSIEERDACMVDRLELLSRVIENQMRLASDNGHPVTNVRLAWYNIPDREHNPKCDTGFIRVVLEA